MPEQVYDGIRIRGAREHNLKNVNLDIPRNQITVLTGLSGSGKSSLAFDTVYAEGQRRYVESLSSYAKNFLQQLKKPEVDSIVGLSPAVAIDQKTISYNPRSTVGTVTEIYDYLRLLFAKVAVPHCPNCKTPVSSQTPKQIFEDIIGLPKDTKFFLLAPVAQGKKGEFLKEFRKWVSLGFTKAKVDGEIVDLASSDRLAKKKAHDIDLIVDRLILKPELFDRLKESLNTALSLSGGYCSIDVVGGAKKSYSLHKACHSCGFSFPEIDQRFFSFNNPRGACPDCNGLGYYEEEISADDMNLDDDSTEAELRTTACALCGGTRLKKEALSFILNDKNIHQLGDLDCESLADFLYSIPSSGREKLISEKIVNELRSRLSYLARVGVGYLSMNRMTKTLSGGEAQRIRLASQLGSALVGILYVLDEPSIGLHAKDHDSLLGIIRDIRDRGNTILMVEHDRASIEQADLVVDLGPRAGVLGGEIIAKGTPKELSLSKKSVTGKYLFNSNPIFSKKSSRKISSQKLTITGASGNNLKNITVDIPLGAFISVTGVSGSGKSTLIIDTLYRALANHFNKSNNTVAPYKNLIGVENLDKVVEINQRPIGRTPRSNPATYIGALPLIRDLFSVHPEAKIRGYAPGRFSFNVKGGRCEECQGAGMVRVEMHFLADVFVQCDRCMGSRYNRETLNIKYREKSIADVLNMSVEEAVGFFKNHSHIHRKLETLHRVGLDYLTLGQSSTTLSGGEAQRVKLSRELSKRSTGRTLYILDEPTTGLHFQDITNLLELLHELVDQGNTVIVIEHQTDVINSSDYIIDLGPGGGKSGGYIIASGGVSDIIKNEKSVTGKFL
ncbi:MAG: excinuclease ABC subunit UvrA [Pseudomonadota bacterium]|nr:excinuclease ABC subunit UvrA [Pseudomonadota bacterium]